MQEVATSNLSAHRCGMCKESSVLLCVGDTHVCLTANTPHWRESDWKCQLSWRKNIHYGGVAWYTSLVYLPNLEQAHSSFPLPHFVHEWDSTELNKLPRAWQSELLMRYHTLEREDSSPCSSLAEPGGGASGQWPLVDLDLCFNGAQGLGLRLVLPVTMLVFSCRLHLGRVGSQSLHPVWPAKDVTEETVSEKLMLPETGCGWRVLCVHLHLVILSLSPGFSPFKHACFRGLRQHICHAENHIDSWSLCDFSWVLPLQKTRKSTRKKLIPAHKNLEEIRHGLRQWADEIPLRYGQICYSDSHGQFIRVTNSLSQQLKKYLPSFTLYARYMRPSESYV